MDKEKGKQRIFSQCNYFESNNWQESCSDVLLLLKLILLALLSIVLNSTIWWSNRACSVACQSVSQNHGGAWCLGFLFLRLELDKIRNDRVRVSWLQADRHLLLVRQLSLEFMRHKALLVLYGGTVISLLTRKGIQRAGYCFFQSRRETVWGTDMKRYDLCRIVHSQICLFSFVLVSWCRRASPQLSQSCSRAFCKYDAWNEWNVHQQEHAVAMQEIGDISMTNLSGFTQTKAVI